jgi:hypothetical protein
MTMDSIRTDSRQRIAFLLALIVDFLDVFDKEVREPESLEEAGLVRFVDPRKGFVERRRLVRGMDV